VRALITGWRGFVGQHLTTYLRSCGDLVEGTDRSEGGPDIIDLSALITLFGAVQPDVVYHLAGQSDVGRSWHDPLGTYRSNVEGTAAVLLACKEAAVQRVVVVTSADVYGKAEPNQGPLREDMPLRPVNPYSASKAAADVICIQATLGYGLEVVRARPFPHIGPGQSPGFVASALASRIARVERDGGDAIAVGALHTRRDYLDVRDVVRAYRLLAQQGLPGEAYNVCTGRDVAVADVADILLSLANRPLHLETDAQLLRPVDVVTMRGDPTKLHELTGWRAEIPLAQTLADLLDYWRDRVADESTEAPLSASPPTPHPTGAP
jgi:GDP-4-dehydro-6-deoxy-D-mannose reductase